MSVEISTNGFDKIKTEAKELLRRLSTIVSQLREAAISSGDVRQKREQLKAVAQTIRKLEAKQVPVPDELRHIRTVLLTGLTDAADEASAVLQFLREELTLLIKSVKTSRTTGPLARRGEHEEPAQPMTPNCEYRPYIIEALQANEGRASARDVFAWIEKRMRDRFLPGDLEVRKDGRTLVWKNRAYWERLAMVAEGILKSNSPRGIWEINEMG